MSSFDGSLQTEFREFASDAIGFPIIAYDEYNNDVEKEMIMKSGYCLRPWIFEASKTLVFLIGISNVVLDYVLTVNLSSMGEHGYATLLGFMTTLSLVYSIWMKYTMYGMRKHLILQPEFIFGYVLITELFIFAFENVATIFIFTRLDEDGDYLVSVTETFGANLNLWTTIFSCVGVILLLIVFIIMSLVEGDRWCIIAPFATIFYISYILYFAVDKVLHENPMEEFEDLYLKRTYMMGMVICFVVLHGSNIVVYYACVFSGGN